MHEWIGRTQTVRDGMDPARAAALHATLGLDGPPPADALPPFWHQAYFWAPEPPDGLGPDGHPATGRGLIPDLGLPQRMWAGGALEFRAPLRAGRPAEKVSTLADVAFKDGRSGRLGFVTLSHEILQDGAACVVERQDLVYRVPPDARAGAAASPPEARGDEAWRERVGFDAALLFRYSALTFNGHRIHYDADYARDVEGHAGAVVHGPLLAQLLMLAAERRLGRLRRFEFRATSPLAVFEHADLCGTGDGEMWVRGPDGRQCMAARAECGGARLD